MTRPTKNRKMRKVTASKQLEVMYRRELDALLRHMLNVALDVVREEPKRINDAPIDWLRSAAAKANRISELLSSINYNAISNAIANRIVLRANSVNAKRFDDKASEAIGVDLKGALIGGSKQVREQLDLARMTNASLITNMTDEFKRRIGKTIMDNVHAGERSTNLITQIMEDYHVTQSRAKLIARDQTSKINGDLTKVRAEAIGVKTYIWSGSLDERERDSHRVMEGKLCKYSDPTVYSDDGGETWKKRKAIRGVELHPSQDYGCRCIGRAVVNFE